MDYKSKYRANREKVAQKERVRLSKDLAEYFSAFRKCIHLGISQERTIIYCNGFSKPGYLIEDTRGFPINPSVIEIFGANELKKFDLGSRDAEIVADEKTPDYLISGGPLKSNLSLADIHDLIRETDPSWKN